jgi:chromosomal replication initiator protein
MARDNKRSSTARPWVLPAGQDLWQTCIEQLAQELPEQQFNTWIKPLSATVASDLSKVTISSQTASSSTGSGPSTARIAAMLEKILRPAGTA